MSAQHGILRSQQCSYSGYNVYLINQWIPGTYPTNYCFYPPGHNHRRGPLPVVSAKGYQKVILYASVNLAQGETYFYVWHGDLSVANIGQIQTQLINNCMGLERFGSLCNCIYFASLGGDAIINVGWIYSD